MIYKYLLVVIASTLPLGCIIIYGWAYILLFIVGHYCNSLRWYFMCIEYA